MMDDAGRGCRSPAGRCPSAAIHSYADSAGVVHVVAVQTGADKVVSTTGGWQGDRGYARGN